MKEAQIEELLLQALETERNGAKVYETALKCVTNKGLREEWGKYLAETRHHIEVVERLFSEFRIDPETASPGRENVRHIGASLISAMERVLGDGPSDAAQLVAAECVAMAEYKDHLDWELIGEVAKAAEGKWAEALTAAYQAVGDQEHEHWLHTIGWARELWIQSLGLQAVLPPPEERRDVRTEVGAARAKGAREQMTF
jgi:ferritin-like metal-binding protein YciE